MLSATAAPPADLESQLGLTTQLSTHTHPDPPTDDEDDFELPEAPPPVPRPTSIPLPSSSPARAAYASSPSHLRSRSPPRIHPLPPTSIRHKFHARTEGKVAAVLLTLLAALVTSMVLTALILKAAGQPVFSTFLVRDSKLLRS